MTDMVKGFTITLDTDIRIDNVEVVLNAIKMIKHVAHVDPIISTSNDHHEKIRLRQELQSKFYDFMRENLM
jgi:hypothetical protein